MATKKTTKKPVKEPTKQTAQDAVEPVMVTVFMKEYLLLEDLPPMYPKVRYKVPEHRLAEFPADSYVKID